MESSHPPLEDIRLPQLLHNNAHSLIRDALTVSIPACLKFGLAYFHAGLHKWLDQSVVEYAVTNQEGVNSTGEPIGS